MKLSNFSKLSFGIGALGKDLCYAIISYFLMIYFTDTIGLTPLFVGNLFLVARVWDAFNDPMMGMVVDNTRSKWGKFRPWILIGTVVNAAVIVFLFKKPLLVSISKQKMSLQKYSMSFLCLVLLIEKSISCKSLPLVFQKFVNIVTQTHILISLVEVIH